MICSYRALSRHLKPVDEGPELLKIVTELFSGGFGYHFARRKTYGDMELSRAFPTLCVGVLVTEKGQLRRSSEVAGIFVDLFKMLCGVSSSQAW